MMAAHVECVQRANCRSLVECPACEGTLDACDADGGPAPAGDLSCMEFAGCAQDCENDPACIEDCTARARPGSPELLQAVGACAARSRCEDNECLERECADPWNACRQDSSGDALCGDVLVCITVCGQDEACARTCMHEGTVAAQDGVQAVFQCASNAGCRSLEGCPQCEREINACDQGAPVPPVDPVGCPELNQCISACEGDLACRRACEDAADDEDVVLFEAILVCAEESGCMDDECVAEQCAEPILACREDSAGEVLCADVWGCMLECVPDGGDPCLQACFQSGTIEAQDLVVDHLDCIGVEMCRDPLDCPQCEATEAACIDHGVVP